jgi:hypothetical protein
MCQAIAIPRFAITLATFVVFATKASGVAPLGPVQPTNPFVESL